MAQPSTLQARKFKSLRTISALTLREMETTYGRTPGGYIWAILEPIGTITILTVVIAIGLRVRSPSIGTVFMLFYATGWLPFAFYTQTAGKIAKSIKFSKQLLSYPGVRYTDALIARFLLNFMTHIAVLYVVMTGIFLYFDISPYLNVPAIVLSFLMAAALGFGVGCFNCLLISVFPLWDSLWTIINRPLFLLSTIIFIFEEIPWRYQDILWYNPLVHIVGMMRRGFYPTYDATYVSPLYVFGLSLVLTFVGLLMLNRYHREILNF